MKVCKICRLSKDWNSYSINSKNKDGHASMCRLCKSEYEKALHQKHKETKLKQQREYYKANKDKIIARQKLNPNKKKTERRIVLKSYGLTLDDYESMSNSQGHVCAICGKSNGDISLCVDHNHSTGKVRGLLCTKCNGALGLFLEDVDILNEAISYLGKYK